MGSFLTLWLHEFPQTEVRHLCQPPKATKTEDFRLVLELAPDTLINLDAVRPTARLAPALSTGPGHYRVTPSVDDWIADISSDKVVLLHIDMDYFSDRYDGDSDWNERAFRLDPDYADIERQIDAVTRALHRVPQIASAAVAFSPGFFPAEHWGPAHRRLRAGLGRLYDEE